MVSFTSPNSQGHFYASCSETARCLLKVLKVLEVPVVSATFRTNSNLDLRQVLDRYQNFKTTEILWSASNHTKMKSRQVSSLTFKNTYITITKKCGQISVSGKRI